MNVITKIIFMVQDAKICFSDDTLPDGYSVKKGDMVCYQPYAMGRMKFIWGDDVEDFRPERWLDENGVFQPESPFKFTAFQVSRVLQWTCSIYSNSFLCKSRC